jgi:hypothetical protein
MSYLCGLDSRSVHRLSLSSTCLRRLFTVSLYAFESVKRGFSTVRQWTGQPSTAQPSDRGPDNCLTVDRTTVQPFSRRPDNRPTVVRTTIQPLTGQPTDHPIVDQTTVDRITIDRLCLFGIFVNVCVSVGKVVFDRRPEKGQVRGHVKGHNAIVYVS